MRMEVDSRVSKSKKLCISSTFYDYDIINRYTWYSNDGKTRKKIDYVLLKNFIQKYVRDCRVEPEFDFASDHRLLKTTHRTPCTRRRTVERQPRKSLSEKNTCLCELSSDQSSPNETKNN